MSKMTLKVAITCFSCLLLVTSFAIADKPEWAGKPDRVAEEQAERAIEHESKKLEREADRELRKEELKAKKAEREIDRQAEKLRKSSEKKLRKAERKAKKAAKKAEKKARKAKRKAEKAAKKKKKGSSDDDSK